jgi:4'-phosphopantetheinyl transferase EntD
MRCAATPLAVCDLVAAGVEVTWSAPSGSVAALFPQERAAVAGAVPQRQREFAAGRGCARAALARFGAHGVVLPVGPDRAPLWPAGFVGSISHSRRLCVAAVARNAAVASIGIDVEDETRLEPELWDWICTDGERRWLRRQPFEHRGRAACVLFSAKEATYKCLTRWLEAPFEPRAIEIEWGVQPGRFCASVAGRMLGPLSGSIACADGVVVTAAIVRRAPTVLGG